MAGDKSGQWDKWYRTAWSLVPAVSRWSFLLLSRLLSSTPREVRQNWIMASDALLTYESLAAVLDQEGITAERYVIGRNRKLQDQVFVVDKWSNRWVVYYSERGSKWDIHKHRTEDEACRDLLSRLRRTG
jgi:hypothetical protein